MIIGISGKIGSGKDTIGKIIQYLTSSYGKEIKGYPQDFSKLFVEWDNLKENEFNSDWYIKKYADKLKDITCLLLGCTREQLEDRDFKEKELGEEWWKWEISSQYGNCYFSTKQEALKSHGNYYTPELVKLTPRLLLQLLGTECGRGIIHPNIWVNSLFSDYKAKKETYPDWIITDVRFPNEAEAIKNRGGILIRIDRQKPFIEWCKEYNLEYHNPEDCTEIMDRTEFLEFVSHNDDTKNLFEHESEIALDDYSNFDYIINNNKDIENLIKQVSFILKKEKIL